MKFTPLASSSRGNAYIVQDDGGPPLLLEAGIPIGALWDRLREHGVSLADLAGCLVSHSHGDHSKSAYRLLTSCVDVWMSSGTADALGVSGHFHRLHTVTNEPFSVEGWIIRPFDLEHDAAEPKGFFVGHGDERCLFIPDTALIENRFKGATIIALEVNYQEEILHDNIVKGALPAVVGRRTRRNHMSLATAKNFLLANDLSRCREIWLLHLSSGNSNEEQMRREIQETTGIPVYVCEE